MATFSGEAKKVLNFNIGVLGHVDSGKTSLSKALSTTASTASFDKNPQSRERGITLDLGFSCFTQPLPGHLADQPYDMLQFTLVDCPGHASLIKTIIGGAQIIDLMILVVDINKGIQTQTAECLVIGQITCDHMIVVLNKVDLIPEAKRTYQIEKMRKRLSKTLESTKFASAPIIAVAANPESDDAQAFGIQELTKLLTSQAYIPERNITGSFLFAVDHCFSLRGQGTVMTGTILQGSVALNDTIEIPSMKVTKKVKSMQMFRQPVSRAIQGDRVGICVTQFDPKLLERGLVCKPSTVPTIFAGIISVEKIHYYKGPIASKAKFHITIGHDTVMGKAQFFGLVPSTESTNDSSSGPTQFDFTQEYVFEEELLPEISNARLEEIGEDGKSKFSTISLKPSFKFALLELEKPVTCPKESLVIGSRLDTDIHLNSCRLAFHGKLLEAVTEKSYAEHFLPKLRVFKTKFRVGEVERLVDDYSLVGRGLFKKETNIQLFLNLKVRLSTGEVGVIEGSFGQSGKFKIRIPLGLKPETANLINAGQKKKVGKGKAAMAADESVEKPAASSVKIILDFKRYIFDPDKKMVQT